MISSRLTSRPAKSIYSHRVSRVSWLAATIALIVAMAACTSEDTAPEVVRAATVGTVVISADSLTAATTAAEALQTTTLGSNSANALTREELMSRQLTAKIQHVLLAQANQTLPTPVTDADVTAALGSATAAEITQQLLVPASDLPDRVRDVLIMTRLVTAAIGSQQPVANVEIEIAMIPCENRAEAREQQKKYSQDPQGVDAIVNTGVTGRTGVGLALHVDPELVASGLYAASVGTLMVLTTGEHSVMARVDKSSTSSAPISSDFDLTDFRALQGLAGLLLAPSTPTASTPGPSTPGPSNAGPSNATGTGAAPSTLVTVESQFGTWDVETSQVIPPAGNW